MAMVSWNRASQCNWENWLDSSTHTNVTVCLGDTVGPGVTAESRSITGTPEAPQGRPALPPQTRSPDLRGRGLCSPCARCEDALRGQTGQVQTPGLPLTPEPFPPLLVSPAQNKTVPPSYSCHGIKCGRAREMRRAVSANGRRTINMVFTISASKDQRMQQFSTGLSFAETFCCCCSPTFYF